MTIESPLHSVELMREAAAIRRALFRDSAAFVFRNALKKRVRRTGMFRECYWLPMNYPRMMELPLTYLLLDPRPSDRILDVSSPKLLAFDLNMTHQATVVAADLEENFVDDFNALNEGLGMNMQTSVFDATREIPFPDSSFDKAFSISVLEHIPADGDRLALREMARVLKPGGSAILTLPVFPHFVEEWTKSQPYWASVQDESGRTFYQRRYDRDALKGLVSSAPELRVERVVLIAERPLAPPAINDNGMMIHNAYLIETDPRARRIVALSKRLRKAPFLDYIAQLGVSDRCHYLASSWDDPNIRQVAVELVKDS